MWETDEIWVHCTRTYKDHLLQYTRCIPFPFTRDVWVSFNGRAVFVFIPLCVVCMHIICSTLPRIQINGLMSLVALLGVEKKTRFCYCCVCCVCVCDYHHHQQHGCTWFLGVCVLGSCCLVCYWLCIMVVVATQCNCCWRSWGCYCERGITTRSNKRLGMLLL